MWRFRSARMPVSCCALGTRRLAVVGVLTEGVCSHWWHPAGTQDAIHSAQACLWALTCSSAELFEPGCGAAYFPTSLLHNQAAWQAPISHPLVKAVRCREAGA